MDIQEEIINGLVIVHLKGRIDTLTAKDLEAHLASLMAEERGQPVLNLKDIDFISSFGLRVILMAAKKLKAEGKPLPLCELSADVRNVFDVSGFSKILPIHDTVNEALTALEGASA